MKKIIYFGLCVCFGQIIFGTTADLEQNSINKTDEAKKIKFEYKNEPLTNVINFIAAEKNLNIIFPKQPIMQKFTFEEKDLITLDAATSILNQALEMSGYKMIPQNDIGDTFEIKITAKDQLARETFNIYINPKSPEDLPNTEEIIKVLFYLNNINLGKEGNGGAQLINILNNVLPNTSILADNLSNSLIITDRGTSIRNVILILNELDRSDLPESMDIIQLNYINAKYIEELFKDLLGQKEEKQFGPIIKRKKVQENQYFSQNTKVTAIPRLNSILVLGSEKTLEKIKNFIAKQIDVPLDSGKSVLHVYELKYIQAEDIIPILDRIVKSEQESPAGQAKGTKETGSTERYFEGVVIQSEAKGIEKQQVKSADISGEFVLTDIPLVGNRLIVAANNKDWQIVKNLLEEIDTPKSQVFIEVLIVDLSNDDEAQLGAAIRKNYNIKLPGGFDYQTSHLVPPAAQDFPVQPMSPDVPFVPLSTDELKTIPATQSTPITDAARLTESIWGTSAMLALNDNGPGGQFPSGIWGLINIFKETTNSQILGHPHFIATHNEEAYFESYESRRVKGEATSIGTGNILIPNIDFTASQKITIIPKIVTYKDEATGIDSSRVNLNIAAEISQFLSTTNNEQSNRNIKTNLTVNDKEIIMIGGLIENKETSIEYKTPILGSIPIIGYLFKNKARQVARSNLILFISPTVILPQFRAGIENTTEMYTQNILKAENEGGLFNGMKDPITRVFFKKTTDMKTGLDFFAQETREEQARLSETKFKKSLESTEKHLKKNIEKSESEILAEKINNKNNTTKKSSASDSVKKMQDIEAIQKIEDKIENIALNTEWPSTIQSLNSVQKNDAKENQLKKLLSENVTENEFLQSTIKNSTETQPQKTKSNSEDLRLAQLQKLLADEDDNFLNA
ncbi:MAG: General secretion pathway protein D [candidate division TM6 bacterium GW2011_GWF2_32_72]|nr:MAG: General secretion pathway protein D [candidate division TM6 bacterium GW2011_GWF2_32_72]